MSIKVLDSNFKATIGEGGIVSYSHPECSTILTSDYKVFNAKNGRELKVYTNEKLIGGQISSRFKGKRANFSFGRLLALMAGQEEKGYYRIIDENKPLTLDNITTLQDYMKSNPKESSIKPKLVKDPIFKKDPAIIALPSDGKKEENMDIIIHKDKIREYFLEYVPCEDMLNFITEDGLIFNDRAKALLHQLNVDKGKELANKVVKAKAGYELAEEMYLSQVDYSTGKPLDYNFRTILDNNTGIREVGERTYLVEADDRDVQQFRDKEELDRWLKAKALVDMVVDMRYNVSKIAELIG